MIVSVIDAECEEFENFPGVVFVGHAAAASFAANRVEVNDHGRTLGADSKHVVEGGIGIHHFGAPFANFPVFEFAGQNIHVGEVIVIAIQILDRLGLLGDEMIFPELGHDLKKLAVGANGSPAVPAAQVGKTASPFSKTAINGCGPDIGGCIDAVI